MSNLSGYDSEAIGFDSVTQNENSESHSGTQTSEFSECMTGSQTYTFQDYGCNVSPADLDTGRETSQFSTEGLNEFLRRVVPSMMDQLDQSTSEVLYNSSESDDEEICTAKLFQEFKLTDGIPFQGAGDQENSSILSLTWSSAGNSLAVSLGRAQHDTWCEHEGLIRIYTMKRSKCDSLVHSIDITEKNCITVVRYHPEVAAILAYGTNSGEIVICNLQNITSGFNQTMQLASPSGFHGSTRVSALQWADGALSNEFLLMQITNTGKRRGAADQVLISSGSDGTVNVWQVNVHLQIFQNIVSYKIDGSRKTKALNISCFDFMKVSPLSQPWEPICEDIFVAGTACGKLYLCSVKNNQKLLESEMVDPVYEVLEGHGTCVLDVAFSSQKPGIFASLSMDSELRVFDVKETAPLMVFGMESALSCMSWVPLHPCLVIVGLASPDKNGQVLQLWNVASGRAVHLEGLTDSDRNAAVTITSLAINQSGACRVAAGDANGRVKIWDMPFNRLKIAPEQYEF